MTSAANTPTGGMPYRLDPVPGWGDTVASWPWQPWLEHDVQLGWKKAGDCPYCEHPMTVHQTKQRYASPVEWKHAQCNCGYPHEGRPTDEPVKGCGQQADIRAASS
ncbi:hypothetical protein AB0I37_05975 [Micromonospora purpureochromogenes]|uniref:hypothetical protein n=1 Tax=Micromonospora purpureochromogenes TaxID=47872 RepID=UPI00340608F7